MTARSGARPAALGMDGRPLRPPGRFHTPHTDAILLRVADDAELERMLADLESDRFERKETASDMDRIAQAVCAFANDMPAHQLPGYVFVGVRDDGSHAGKPVTDELLLKLAALRDDGRILPPPRLTVAKRHLAGGDVAVIEVFPSPLPPVRFRGVVWIRVGPRRAHANEIEERALSERRATVAGRTWDARPATESTRDDLALDLFYAYRTQAIDRSVIAENHRSDDDQLASLRFLDRRSRCPTNAGVLTFGRDPRFFYPGAYLQLVWYEGTTSASEVLRERVIDGDLLSVLRQLDDVAKDVCHARPVTVAGFREEVRSDYPIEALREAWANAVIHRDYESNTPTMITILSDRIEVLSPGGLYGDLIADEFPGPTAYRNPILAEAAKVLGYVNRFGRGVPRIRDAMERNDSPAPIFDPRPGHFFVALPRRA